jgi:hypothetical protein
MKLTLNIPDSNTKKAIPLIEYLKSLDYVSIELEEDIEVSSKAMELVRNRIKNSNPELLLDWEVVKNKFIKG